MRYLMLIKHAEDYRKQDRSRWPVRGHGRIRRRGLKSGAIIDTAGLKPTADGNRVQLRGHKITVTDGPFTETKEIIGGYALMEMKSNAEALEYARKFMDLHLQHWPEFEGECEVRPVEDQQ